MSTCTLETTEFPEEKTEKISYFYLGFPPKKQAEHSSKEFKMSFTNWRRALVTKKHDFFKETKTKKNGKFFNDPWHFSQTQDDFSSWPDA